MLSIGLMSGTSMDGIDAALLDIDDAGQIIELGHVKLDYTPETRHLLKSAERAIKTAQGDLQLASSLYPQSLREYLTNELQLNAELIETEVSRLTTHLQTENKSKHPLSLDAVIRLSTTLHAHAVQLLLEQTGKRTKDIDVIGYHGQTMYHNPSRKITIQVGDGVLLAELTHITVVNNFRGRDVEMGGQGAPFAPIYHQALAIRDKKIPLAVVNCGGIANISLITHEQIEHLIGFDTGPGNGLIDAFIRKRTGGLESMDFNGHYGSQGQVNDSVLQILFDKSILKDGGNYFLKKPPKSLDIRDMVLIPELDALSLEDACATLEAFTAEMIVQSLSLIELPHDQIPRHWVLAGGGWYNPVITSELKNRLHAKFGKDIVVETAAQAGWNSDAMEAQIFAYFAVRSLHNLPLSVPNTTHVPRPMSGGHAHVPLTSATLEVQSLLVKNPDVLRGYTPTTETELLIQKHRASSAPPDKLLTTESPHPLTLKLSELAKTDLPSAYGALVEVDQAALTCLSSFEERVNQLAQTFADVLRDGYCIKMSGCGSATRAATVATTLFRKTFPDLAEQVIAINAGGDLVIVRAAEGFEDKPEYGKRQLVQTGWNPGDLYVGISASGAAGFVNGQIEYVLESAHQHKPIFFICNTLDECITRFAEDEKTIFHRTKQAKLSQVDVLDICVGEMGVSGSTRMQAATIQLAVIAFALLQAGHLIHQKPPLPLSALIACLRDDLSIIPIRKLSVLTQFEIDVYAKEHYVAYHARPDIALTVATDTTERSPTFNWTYFENDTDANKSVKTASRSRIIVTGQTDNAKALEAMLGRPLQPLNWVGQAGEPNEPKTTLDYLLGYDLTDGIISKRRVYMPSSEPKNIFVEMTDEGIQFRFSNDVISISLQDSLPDTLRPLYQQLILKMILNIHSTLVAGCMGCYRGNSMTSVRASNLKLVNRAIALSTSTIQAGFFQRKLPPPDVIQQPITRSTITEILYRMMLCYRPGESIVFNTADVALSRYETLCYVLLLNIYKQSARLTVQPVPIKTELPLLTHLEVSEIITQGKKPVLCLDGGGTYFRLSILSPDSNQPLALKHEGIVSSIIKMPGGNCNAVGWESFEHLLDNALHQIEVNNQCLADFIREEQPIIVIGMAGMGQEKNRQQLTDYFKLKSANPKHVLITTDAETYLAALPSFGAVLVAGTGSSCFGITSHGERVQAGGLGAHLSCDPGSAFAVGRLAVLHCLQLMNQADIWDHTEKQFIDKQDELYLAIKQKAEQLFGIPFDQMVGYLNREHFQRTRMAELAPIIFEYAFARSPSSALATKIISESSAALAHQLGEVIHTVLSKETTLTNKMFPVILVGGIFDTPYRDQLLQQLQQTLTVMHPDVKIDWQHQPSENYVSRVVADALAPAPVYRFA